MKSKASYLLNLTVVFSMALAIWPVSVQATPLESTPLAANSSQGELQETPEIEVEPELLKRFSIDDNVAYLIYFREEPDLSPAYEMDWNARGHFVVQTLQETAERSQEKVRAYLDTQGVTYKAFWIDNVVAVELSSRATFDGLLKFGEIEALRARRMMSVIEPVHEPELPTAPQAVEPNINHVLAPDVWAMGFRGEGMVVANIDTGVRYTHEALVRQYRGTTTGSHDYNWLGAAGGSPTPVDDHGHGSHTMGTMVGEDAAQVNQIGMTPGAQWIACDGCESTGCPDAALLTCAQWIAAPYPVGDPGSPDPDMRPHAVNNSWGDCDTSYDPWYQGSVDAWHAAGIYPIFSNGNASNCGYPAPPGLNTVGNPARYGNVTGVGSSGESNGQYATHSNWGPTDNLDTVNAKPGYEDMKPQVVAPGVSIRSSTPGSDSEYQDGWSGTSMSAPHVTGLIALIWQAAPCLTGDYATTEVIIEETATPIYYDDGVGGGSRWPNYAAGWGEINALAAVQTAMGMCGDSVLQGAVTEDGTTPVADATIVATLSPTQTWQTTSDLSGVYEMTVFSGTFTIDAFKYGHQVYQATGVTVVDTTTHDILLPPLAPSSYHTVDGVVTDAATGWPLYAHISISGDLLDPLPPYDEVWTDPATGYYSIMLAEGITFTFDVETWVPGYDPATHEIAPLTSDRTEDFALNADLVACTAPGYTLGVDCIPPADGGLVVGNVYDENTGDPLPGAEIVSDGGAMATAVETPDDGAVDDAFYTLFSPSGNHVFTATMRGGYSADIDTVAVTDGDTVAHDFSLAAGLLDYTPEGLAVTVELGYTDTLSLDLANLGGVDVPFKLREREAGVGFQILSSGGPDTFGYVFADSNEPNGPTYDWIDISGTGTPVMLGDDQGAGPFSLGFTFNFYGNDYTEYYVSSNGYLGFNNLDLTDLGNDCPVPNGNAPDDSVYLMWDDLNPGGTAPLYYQSFAACPYGGGQACVIVQYQDYLFFGGGYAGTFEAILFENGNILIQFEDAGDREGSGSTTGIENSTADDGLTYPDSASCNTAGSVQDELAVCFAYPGLAADCVFGDAIPWLSEEPLTGTVSALGTETIAVNFDAAYVDQPGEYYAELMVGEDTPYDVANVPVTMTVLPPTSWGKLEGTVTGLGVCDVNPTTLEGADVLVESSIGVTWSLTTDVSGTYQLWLDEGHSPLTVTVTAPDYYGEVGGVMVEEGETTTLDFSLRALLPCLSYDPANFDVTLDMGDNTMEPLTLMNTGAGVAEYELVELNAGFLPLAPIHHILQSDGDFARSAAVPSLERAPVGGATGTPVVNSALLSVLSGAPAYGVDLLGDQFVYFVTDDATNLTNIAGATQDFYAGDFVGGDFSTLYAIDNATQMLYAIDTATGVATTVGSCVPQGGHTWVGMSGDPTSGVMYVYSTDGSTNVLYTVDLGTGAATQVGAGTSGYVIIDIAISPSGQMYGVDIAGDQLVSIDKTSNAITSIGSIGFDASYAQGMDFDEAANTLYLAAYNAGISQAELRIADTSTGATVLVSTIGAGAGVELDAFAIATGGGVGGAIPWLSEDPITGTIPADTNEMVALTFDAGVPETMQPGEYYGQLKIDGNAPHDIPNVPVTLTVNAPDTWGELAGVVTGLGYCDVATPTLLEDAEVTVEGSTGVAWVLTTDVSGTYQLWLDEAHSPLTVTVVYPGHVTQVFTDVLITAGATTALDVALRWAQPCLTVDPDMFDVTVELGMSTTLPLSLTNVGAVPASFDLVEQDMGFMPMRPVRLITQLAGAGAVDVRAAPAQAGFSAPVYVPTSPDVLIDEGFEGGMVPPAGWDAVVTNGGYTWKLFTSPHSGSYAADIEYDPALVPQDEWLLSPEFSLAAGTLSFWSFGSIYWCRDTYDNCDLNVWIVVGPDAGDGDDIYVGTADGDWPDNWIWAQSVFDLTPLLPGGFVRIGFQYEGVDGAQIALDDILLDGVLGAGSIPWLHEDPVSGTVASDSTFVVDLTFDASDVVTQVTQPGEYFGTLTVRSDDPVNDEYAVPVTMTVTPPATWGKVMGTVQSLGYCDAETDPLAGLNVLVEGSSGMTWTVTTDVSGTYQLWLDESESTITVTVEAPDHEKGEALGVVVTAGMTTTQDFDLRWLMPCVTVEPDSLHATLELGTSDTLPMTLTNTGAAAADWDLSETSLWLTENPVTGTLAADTGTAPVTTTFDASLVDQPGEYYADLWVNSDDPMTPTVVPVTMTVTPPASWALLDGTVTGLDHCDVNTATLEGAEVLVESWTTTTAIISQTLWEEDFEGAFPPAGWTLTQTGDIADPGWVHTSLRANSGTYSAYHNDDNLTTDAVSWLILPQVAIPADGGELAFWQNENYYTYYTYHGIWVSTATNDPADFVELTELGAGTEDTWEERTVDLSAYAGQSIYVAFRYEGDFADEWYVDDVRVTTFGTTDVPAVSWLLETDENGYYSIWLPADTYTVTVSEADHVGAVVTLTIAAGVSQTQDFALRWLGPCLSVETVEYHLTQPMGMSGTLPLTLTNTGAGEATFEFSDQGVGFVMAGPTHAMPATAPLPDTVATDGHTFSVNPNPPVQSSNLQPAAPRAPDEVQILTHSLSQVIQAGNSVSCNAGGLHADNSYLRVFDLAAFGVVGDFTVTSVEVGIESAAGTGGTQPVEVRLYTLDGALLWSNMTLIGSASVSISDQALSHFNVPVTGVAPAGSILVVEFFTPDGQTAGHSLFVGSNNLGQTAPTYLAAAACGVVEPTETAAIGFPDMHLVMSVTGETALDALWLFEDPITGTVSADGGQLVADITMDAAYVAQPGEYYAILLVATDDPVIARATYPVTMTVSLPTTFGQITGTVTGLGPCDDPLATTLLEDATVVVESATWSWNLTTDENGVYDLWLDEAHSPVTITVDAAGYVSQTVTGVTIVSGTTTVVDFSGLRPLEPCAAVAPTSIHEVVTLGMSTTVPMTVSNTGADDLAWVFSEDGGDVSWLSEDPATGMTIGDSTSAVTVTLDASVPEVDQPGDYAAALYLDNDSINDPITVPVTMTVPPPATWGKLGGTVQSLGHCDTNPEPLEGARVLVQSWMTETVTLTLALLEEDFEGTFPPAGWTVVDTIATGNVWNRNDFFGVSNATTNGGGSGYSADADSGAICGTPWDTELWSPPIDLTGVTSPVLSFASNFQDFAGAGEVWLDVSTDGGTTWPDNLYYQTTDDAGGTGGGGVYREFDLSAYTGQTILLRWRYSDNGDGCAWFWQIDTVRVEYDFAGPRPVEWLVTTDMSGTYSLWMDEMYSPLTITISHEGGHEPQVFNSVVISAGVTTVVNADLVWLQPCVVPSPETLELSVPMGTSTTVSLDLENLGAITSPFLLGEWSLGVEPLGPLAAGGPDGFGYRYADSNQVGTSPVYDFMDISVVGTPLVLGDNDFAEVPLGFDFKFYGNSPADPNIYDTVFVNSNGFLSFGAGSTDLSPDPVLPDMTLPNNIIAALWDNLASGANGMVYYQSFDLCPYSPSEDTLDACFIVQYDSYEYADGGAAGTWEVILFRTGSILMQFAEADAPGATTGIEGPLGVDGLTYTPALADDLAVCFAYPGEWTDCQSTAVPWLEVEPAEGDLGAYSTVPLTVTLDASVSEVSMPGDYLAELNLFSDDPFYPVISIPVTMTVAEPATLGKMWGTVYAWDQCDTARVTMADALVEIESGSGEAWMAYTDAEGDYGMWLPVGETVTTSVYADGYVAVTVVDSVTAGVMPAHDVELRVDVPCISVTPSSFDVILAQNNVVTHTMTIQNAGAGDLAYSDISGSSLWLSVGPASGIVPADSNVPVNLIFDATGLVAGDIYSTVLEIAHTSVAVDRIFVRPVRMTVVEEGYTVFLPLVLRQ